MIAGNKIRLHEKRLADAKDDYAWQTDRELVELDASPLITITFPQYLAEYTSQLCYPYQTGQRFAIDTLDGKHVGNCAYYGIDETKGEAELGIMIGNRDYWDKGYGADAVDTLVNHIFRQTNLKRIHLKTLDWNIRAQKCFQKCGFTPCGHSVRDGYSFVLMELHRDRWESCKRNEVQNER